MSNWCNYESNPSTDYDQNRIAVASEAYLGFIRQHSPAKSFSETNVLDLGCGTGNYAKVLLDAGIKNTSCSNKKFY